MLRYRLAIGEDLQEFMGDVNAMIVERWIPQGGVTVAWRIGDDGVQTFVYFQALIRYGDCHTWEKNP